MSEMKSCYLVPKPPPRATMQAGVKDITPLHIEMTKFYPMYYEYEVTADGVTRYLVYLPEGVKPPREGSEP